MCPSIPTHHTYNTHVQCTHTHTHTHTHTLGCNVDLRVFRDLVAMRQPKLWKHMQVSNLNKTKQNKTKLYKNIDMLPDKCVAIDISRCYCIY
jgi:hypothetical protein